MKKIFALLKLILIYGYVNAQCVTPPPATITVNKTLVCRDEGVVITASVQGVAHYYEWYKNNVLVHSGYGTYNIYQSVTEPGPYKVRYYTDPNAGCYSPFSNEITFQIQEIPVVDVTPQYNSRICSGGTTNLVLSSSNVPDATFSWTVDPGSFVSGASDGTGNVISQTLTNTYTGSPWSNVLYSVRANRNGCISNPVQVSVSVHPIPILQATSPTTICEGGNVTFFAAPSNGSIQKDGGPLPPGPTQSGSYTYKTSNSGLPGCVATSTPILITVLPAVTPTISTSTPTTICTGGSVTLVASSPPINGNFSYEWSRNGAFVGGTQKNYTASTPGTYSVRVENTSCNLQGNYYSWATIPVTENLVNPGWISSYAGNLNNPPQIVCQGGDPSPFAELIMGIGAGTTNYQWKVSYDGVTYNSVQNATGATYDVPAGVITQTSSYIRVTSSALNNVTCYGNSNPVNVLVNPTPSFTPGVIAPVCSGSVNQVFLPYTNLSGEAFQYRIDWTTLSDIPWSPLPANQIPISIPSQPGNYSAGVYLRSTSSCESLMYPITVVVYPKPSITTSNKAICSGQSTDLYLSSDVAGSAFSWIVQSKSASISGVAVGATGITSTISHVLTNSSVSTAGSVVYRVTPTANGCTGAYKDITVTVNANVTGGQVAANQTICPGGDPVAFTQTSAATGPGTLNYQWQSSVGGVTYDDITGATATTYNVLPGLTQTTYYKRVTFSTQNAVTCSANSNPITVTVNSLTGGTIAANQTICSGGNPVAFTQTSPAVGPGTLSYQWQKSTNGTAYSNITGATTTTYDDQSGLTQTTHYKRNVTSSLCGLSTSSNPVTVSVDSVNASITPASKEFCSGQPISVTLTATSGTGYTYQWKKAGVNIAGATSSTYQATQTGSYTVTVTNSSGCQKTSNAAVVSQSTGTGNIRQFGDLCADGYVDLVAAWASAGSNFMWSTNETTQTIRVYNAGTYSVNYTSTSACNMSASTLVELIPNPGPCIYSRQASIKPDENEIENKSSGITLYPNPADATLTIHLPEPVKQNVTVSLYSQYGQEVKSAVLVKGEYRIEFDTKLLSNGMYVLTLRTTSGNINMNRKVIINH